MKAATLSRAPSKASVTAHAELVDAAMDVGVAGLVHLDQRVDHRRGFCAELAESRYTSALGAVRLVARIGKSS